MLEYLIYIQSNNRTDPKYHTVKEATVSAKIVHKCKDLVYRQSNPIKCGIDI